ncbi:MAG: SRPBCC family protein [Gemmatimonadetes bacterium]|nr:SRPBCC family protein [Gemmatimonadota bacterium]NIR77334.1 SRPBCC family protein [Gemmatimonadota bacterium]NIT85860.1 SRPBCC family protein [Gemmatimonadota bacterium]NIU29682.1 SRPBCC family protein [Gemmatimonadota bacterium]NIU34726.1 SRPBCC family protein [Gemmatimonadota bacterium]
MKWFFVFTAAVAGLIAIALVVGWLLPESHVATVVATLEGPPDEVWSTINDAAAFPEWRPGVESVEIGSRGPDGPTRWVERSGTGALPLRVEEREPPERLVLRIDSEDLPFGGTWTYELEADGHGTRVTITERGEIYNPFFRFVARFFLGYEATMRDYLEGLESRMAGR